MHLFIFPMKGQAAFCRVFSVDMWEIHSQDQVITLLWSAVLGALLCMFYDVFRAWRRINKSNAVSVAVQDIFFWLISAIVTFLFMLARTCGEIRFFVFAGLISGFVLFRLSLSRFWIIPFVLIFRFLRYIKTRVYAFYIVILTRLTAFLGCFFTLCVEKFKNIHKVRKKLLKKGSGVLYTEHINESKDM